MQNTENGDNMEKVESPEDMEKIPRTGRQPSFGLSIALILVIAAVMLGGIVGLGVSPHMPLFIALVLTVLTGLYLKYPYMELEEALFKGISKGLMPMFFMILIGMIIGTWIACGTIPYLIYLGVQIISPQWFLLTAMLVCCVISMCTGSSWTSAGTLGLAFMGIGYAIGMPPALTAGAVVCGSVFGDKQSPLSETTIFAAGVAEVSVFDHVRSMLWSTAPALLISGIIFVILGFNNAPQVMDTTTVSLVSDTLASSFDFSPLLLIPPVLLLVIIIMKVPGLLGVGIGALVGIIFCMIFQGHSLGEAFTFAHFGFVGNTGVEAVDSMISRGGLDSMMYTNSQLFIAFAMGGILEHIGVLEVILKKLSKVANSVVGLISATLASVLALEFVTADTYLPMLLTGRTLKPAYDKQKLHGRVLSRSLEDTGTLGAWMVPWSTCGVFAAATLGVSVVEYLPYYFLGWITPFISIILAVTGIGIFYTDGKKRRRAKAEMPKAG